MEDAQGFLGHPEVGFFSMLLIGVLAGWIADIRTLVAAIVGAILILFVWHRVHQRA